ncbi:hypothetical protein D3C81_2188460 [compost metagenome]
MRLLNIVGIGASIRGAAVATGVELKARRTAGAVLNRLAVHLAAVGSPFLGYDLRAIRIHANPQARQSSEEPVHAARQ